MLLRKRIAPNAFMTTGLLALVLADTTRMILRHMNRTAGPFADGLIGLCFGVAIASLLVWVTMRGRARG